MEADIQEAFANCNQFIIKFQNTMLDVIKSNAEMKLEIEALVQDRERLAEMKLEMDILKETQEKIKKVLS